MINIFWEVPDNYVSFAIEIVFLLFVENDLFSINSLVVHLVHTSLGLFFFYEIKIAKSELFVGLLVEDNLSTLNFVSTACEKLIQVQIIGIF